MKKPDGFYTIKGYSLLSAGNLTSAMEDYLEMIARIKGLGHPVRVVDLSRQLHVKSSSVTKMVQQLVRAELVSAPKYGTIELTEKGEDLGAYLLYRHNVLHEFLCLLNHTANELEQTEKIEHFIDRRTIEHLGELIPKLRI